VCGGDITLPTCLLYEGAESRVSAVSVTSSPPTAAAAAAARGRGLPLVTNSMLNDAIRRVRPTAPGQSGTATPPRHDQDRGDGSPAAADERSPAGGRRLRPRPVTTAPAGGAVVSSAAGDGQPEWPGRHRTCDVDSDVRK